MLDLLTEEKISFKLGLHMVKCRSQLELDRKNSLAVSIEKEADFFSSQKPWKHVEDRSLFGTIALREKLAALQKF